MSNLDNLFREKLQDREFEFDEAYWQGASKMIAAQAGQKRKRRFLWWLFAGLFIGAIGIGVWFIQSSDKDEQVSESRNPILELDLPKKELENKSSEASAIKENLQSDEKDNYKETSENQIGHVQIIEDPNTQKTLIKTNASTPKTGSKSSQSTEIINKELLLPKSIQNEDERTKTEKPIAQVPNSSTDTEVQIFEDEKLELMTIEMINSFVEYSENYDLEGYLSENQINEDPFFRKYLALGIRGGVSILPGHQSNNTDVAGYSTGLSVQYSLNKKWNIGSELNYFLFKSDFGVSSTSKQYAFGYGGEYDHYSLLPSSLHYLNVPVYLERKFRKHGIYGGVAVDFLIGAYGEMGYADHVLPWERSEEENQFVEEQIAMWRAERQGQDQLGKVGPNYRYFEGEIIEKGWLDTQNINKLQAQLLLGYQYQATKNFNLGLRVQYRLRDYHKLYEHFPRNQNKFMVQLSGSYYFMKKNVVKKS